MSTRLVVDQHNELKEWEPSEQVAHNRVMVVLANIVSYIFHPLFIPVYVIWFLVQVQTYLFAGFTPVEKIITVLRFFCDV